MNIRRSWLISLLKPDLYIPAGLALTGILYAIATLDRSSYWLDYDTPQQAVEALDFITGCWNSGSGKPGVVLTLASIYHLFGPSALAETVVLVGLRALTIVSVYYLTFQISRSRLLATISGLFALALPAYLYYSRTHIGHPVAWLMFGILALSTRRWWLAGPCLTMSIMAHGTFILPVGLLISASIFTGHTPNSVKAWGQFLGFMALPWLFYEALGYAFTGILFEWTRGTIAWIFFYQRSFQQTDWMHVWETVRLANQPIPSILLAASVLYPFVWRKKKDFGMCIYVTAWGVLGIYTVRAGLTHGRFIPRAIAGIYLVLAVLAVITLGELLRRASQRFPKALSGKPAYRIAALLVSIAFVATFTPNLLALREFSRTAYPAVEAVFREAALHDQPVRYWGNQWAAIFFAKLYGVRVAIDDPDPELAALDTSAILVFDGDTLGMRSRLDSRADLYQVSTYPHFRSNLWPADTEIELPTSAMPGVTKRYQDGLKTTALEIWRPIQMSGTFTARDDRVKYVYYYMGKGCFTEPRYGYGTLNWYEVVWNKLLSVWRLKQ